MVPKDDKKSKRSWLKRSAFLQDITGGTHGLSYLRNLARGNRVERKAELETLDNERRPVLLIHGFLGTRGSMYLLEKRLVDDGFTVLSFNLGSLNSRDIRGSAFLIGQKVERLLQQAECEEIDIIGHSMGGLIGLYYIKKLGGHRFVRRLITMGTPARGTWAALAGVALLGVFSTSSWQLLPKSRFLDELSQGAIPQGVQVFSIVAARDRICPPSSTYVPGAERIVVPMGHASLVVSEEVYQRIRAVLMRDNGENTNAKTDAKSG